MSANPKKRSRFEAGLGFIEPKQPASSKRRQYNDVGDILQFLDAQSPEVEPKKRPDKPFKFKQPGPFSVSTQALVVYLRFGTIKNDEKRWLSSGEVLKRTGVRSSAQANIIARWRRRGFRIESHVGRRGKELLLNQ